MDFLPGGSSSKKVSLGGRRKEAKSKQALLDEAKAKREQRQAQAAPSKAAVYLQRRMRGIFGRRRVADMLSMAAERSVSLPTSRAQMLSTARLLGLLWANVGSVRHLPAVAARTAAE